MLQNLNNNVTKTVTLLTFNSYNVTSCYKTL